MEQNAFPDAPPLPQREAALFLDLDGTLIEIAPRPDAVVVPPHLPALLARLSAGLGGAVAIVTGRGLEVARGLTQAPPIAFAAEHGTIIDASALPGAAIPPMPLPPFPPEDWRAAAEAFAEARPGLLLEEKKHGFVLHFRAVPERGKEAAAFLRGLAEGTDFQVLPAHAAAELRPRATDKGVAVSWLMRHAPFAGRTPIFIGDDVTDEFGIEACRALGGTGYRIPRDFAGPAAVLAWLDRIAARLPA
ncbi:trehalose-phosphatase [Teichococcus aestuarii]|uniref:Trehalose 6-phosphate phosphatase n=1 Tax=Teichococcus aestuarii TaxID=568898 RepID=A0A2U1V1M0_9PROT|nr:trehalose-phosphatase [Pseudoroseomonas aestuarii]PWC27761.1 trehalose-phosphatase [Pseudoroseomonas aestuarii]